MPVEKPAPPRESQNPILGKSDIVVILMDMQQKFLVGIPLEKRSEMIRGQLEVLEYCRVHNIPVIVLEFNNVGETIPELKAKLATLPAKKYITKPSDDGFKDTDLKSVLSGTGAKYVLFMGINGCACVRETAKSALKHGYGIITNGGLIADITNKTSCIDWFETHDVYATYLAALKRLLGSVPRAVK